LPLTDEEIECIKQTLSETRFQTYLNATSHNSLQAILLYEWNVKISSALIVPLHYFEIANRNAILRVIIEVYGEVWHDSEGFRMALPNPSGKFYSPRRDLISVVKRLRDDGVLSAGKVVAELKFAFWEQMLTKRYDSRLWARYLTLSYPYKSDVSQYWQSRAEAKNIVFATRELRNRIAHHEPIFTRDILSEYQDIIKLISWCSEDTAKWLNEFDTVMDVLSTRPS